MNFKEFAVGTPHETHTLIAGCFTAKIRRGKYLYCIDCADTCPIEIASSFLELANENPLAKVSYKNFMSEYEKLLNTLKNI